MTQARWWHQDSPGVVACELCPRQCRLQEGETGFCGVRQASGGAIQALSYGGSSGFAVDPIEKKPLFHFLPGTPVLSFGGVGCNLACDFCQNWQLAWSLDLARLVPARPADVVALAKVHRCPSVAFTYNEPIVAAEFVLDAAAACHEANLNTVAVTAGFILEPARSDFFATMDAANIDLKGIRDTFYRRHSQASVAPILETLEHVARQGRTWLEITNLLIPGENDAEADVRDLAAWVAEHCGPHVPLHLTAFHPAHRLLEVPSTPISTLRSANTWARAEGLRYVYLGNVLGSDGSDTCCPACSEVLLRRNGFRLSESRLSRGACTACGRSLEGRFEPA